MEPLQSPRSQAFTGIAIEMVRSPACGVLKLQCYSISKERAPDTATETRSGVKSLRGEGLALASCACEGVCPGFCLASKLPRPHVEQLVAKLDLKPCSGHVVRYLSVTMQKLLTHLAHINFSGGCSNHKNLSAWMPNKLLNTEHFQSRKELS